MDVDGEAAAVAEIARLTSRTRSVAIVLALPIVLGLGFLAGAIVWFVQALLMDRIFVLPVGVAFAAPFALAFRVAPMLGDWWLMTRGGDWVKSIAKQHGLAESDVREMLTALE